MKITITNVKSERKFDNCVYSTVIAYFHPVPEVTTGEIQAVVCDVKSKESVHTAQTLEGAFRFQTRQWQERTYLALTFVEHISQNNQDASIANENCELA
jgi:hypothetical protein